MNDQEIMEWLVAGLWSLTVVLFAWAWVPAILSALGLTRYENGGDEDTSRFEPTDDEPDFAFWAEQFAELGYEPLGEGWLRLIWFGDRWIYSEKIRVFHRRSEHTYGWVQKGDKPFDFWGTAHMATVLSDGSLAVTSNTTIVREQIGEDHIHVGTRTINLGELESTHREVVGRWKSHRRPDPNQSLDALLTATREHADAELRRTARPIGREYLLVNGLFHFSLSVPLLIVLGADHWGLPLSNLVLLLMFRFGHAGQQMQAADSLRRKIYFLRRKQIEARRKKSD